MKTIRLLSVATVLLSAVCVRAQRLEILFLGDKGHHVPAQRFPELMQGLGARGVNLSYTDKMADINAANLAQYDALMIYANTDVIAPDQEKAMLDYVRGGKGLAEARSWRECVKVYLQAGEGLAAAHAQTQKLRPVAFRVLGLVKEPELALWAAFLVLTPFYIFKNGKPQPADMITVLILPVLARRGRPRPRTRRLAQGC